MMRRCKWCGKDYDTSEGSSVFCSENPHHGKGANRAKKSMRGLGKVILGPVLVMKPNPWVKEAA